MKCGPHGHMLLCGCESRQAIPGKVQSESLQGGWTVVLLSVVAAAAHRAVRWSRVVHGCVLYLYSISCRVRVERVSGRNSKVSMHSR